MQCAIYFPVHLQTAGINIFQKVTFFMLVNWTARRFNNGGYLKHKYASNGGSSYLIIFLLTARANNPFAPANISKMRASFTPLLTLVVATLTQASVTCVKVGATTKATWVNSAAETCTWTGTVGSNFGTNTVNAGE